MALLVGGPKDGEVVEAQKGLAEITVLIPTRDDDYPLRLIYSRHTINLLGTGIHVYARAGLAPDQILTLTRRHVVNQLGKALIAEYQEATT